MYHAKVDHQVRQFLRPVEEALIQSKAFSALARLYTLGTILQAYEDLCRAANPGKQSQLDLFYDEVALRAAGVRRDRSKP